MFGVSVAQQADGWYEFVDSLCCLAPDLRVLSDAGAQLAVDTVE